MNEGLQNITEEESWQNGQNWSQDVRQVSSK